MANRKISKFRSGLHYLVFQKVRTYKWLLVTLLVVILPLLLGIRLLRITYVKWNSVNQGPFESLLSYIQHPPILCQTALTVGGSLDTNHKMDGDKLICLKPGPGLRKNCIVYSFGINDEWSFDEAMEKYGCRVFSFDPTMKVDNHNHSPKIAFFHLGISNVNENKIVRIEQTTWKFRTFDYFVDLLGHGNETIDVLKMDIEGDEWDVLEHLIDNEYFERIVHLCVEIHLNFDLAWNRKLQILKRLELEAKMNFFSSRKNNVSAAKRIPGTVNQKEQLFYELAWYRGS